MREQRLPLWVARPAPHKIEPGLLLGPLLRPPGDGPPFHGLPDHGSATAFRIEPLSPCGMPEQTAVLLEVLAFEWASGASPFTLPPQLVPPLQPPAMDFQRLAWPPPLLEPPLPFGAGGPPAPNATQSAAGPLETVVPFPLGVCPLCPGEPIWPGSPRPCSNPNGTGSDNTEFSHLCVDFNEGLLPLSDLEQLVSPLGPVTWVFYMGFDTFARFDVRPSIQIPVFPAYPSGTGLFPG